MEFQRGENHPEEIIQIEGFGQNHTRRNAPLLTQEVFGGKVIAKVNHRIETLMNIHEAYLCGAGARAESYDNQLGKKALKTCIAASASDVTKGKNPSNSKTS
jgi:hypothetical protein